MRTGVREAVAAAVEEARSAHEQLPPMEVEVRCPAFWREGVPHGMNLHS